MKENKTMLNRVSYSFGDYNDPLLDEFTGGVVLGFTTYAADFPDAPFPAANLTLSHTAFHNAVIAAADGGALALVFRDQKRDELMVKLRANAAYVQSVASDDLHKLLSSGYLAVSTNRAQTPLPAPEIKKLNNSFSGMLVATIKMARNTKSLEVQYKNGADWLSLGTFPNGRNVLVPGLTAGQIYSVRARGIGGSTGSSQWSDPVSRMVN